MISHPSETAAPSIYTDFINGVKFDICEVDKCAYSMLSASKYRFFICVEDCFITGFKSAEKLCATTGEDRWDTFCMTKGECLSLINDFSEAYDRIIELTDRAENKPALRISSIGKANSIRSRMMGLFGTTPI
jgi:hypothetical protein